MGNLNKAVMLGNSNSGICKGRFRGVENGILNGFCTGNVSVWPSIIFATNTNTRDTLVTAAGAAQSFVGFLCFKLVSPVGFRGIPNMGVVFLSACDDILPV